MVAGTPLVAAQGGHAARSTHGARGLCVEKSGVHQPVDAPGDRGAHLCREVLTPAHDHIGAKLAHQLLVGR